MCALSRDAEDERNGLFDPDLVFEELRPGLVSGKRPKRVAADDGDRLTPRDRGDIPQESLAARIRR
jgi:hypothetical protein